MERFISEKHAKEAISTLICDCIRDKKIPTYDDVVKALLTCPTAEPYSISSVVTERKVGKWVEQQVFEDGKAIEEWQSCKCSVCGRYDTRPYMYYFDNPNYCSHCGAKMERRDDAKNN